MLAEHDVDQVEAEEPDAPEPDHARESEQHADQRVPPPARIAEELGERAELGFAGGRRSSSPGGGFPALGLFEAKEDRNRQKRRGPSPIRNMIRHELSIVPPPRAFPGRGWSRPPACCRRPRVPASKPSANGRARSDMTSATRGHSHRELPAHPQPGQEPIEREVADAGGERAQARECRVAQDRQHHCLGAAELVAEDPEKEPADRPADHEDRRRDTAVPVDLLPPSWRRRA